MNKDLKLKLNSFFDYQLICKSIVCNDGPKIDKIYQFTSLISEGRNSISLLTSLSHCLFIELFKSLVVLSRSLIIFKESCLALWVIFVLRVSPKLDGPSTNPFNILKALL